MMIKVHRAQFQASFDRALIISQAYQNKRR